MDKNAEEYEDCLTGGGDSTLGIRVIETMLLNTSCQVNLRQVGGVVVGPAAGVRTLVLVDVDSDTAG